MAEESPIRLELPPEYRTELFLQADRYEGLTPAEYTIRLLCAAIDGARLAAEVSASIEPTTPAEPVSQESGVGEEASVAKLINISQAYVQTIALEATLLNEFQKFGFAAHEENRGSIAALAQKVVDQPTFAEKALIAVAQASQSTKTTHGDVIFDYLKSVFPRGVTLDEISEASGLTREQAVFALSILKRNGGAVKAGELWGWTGRAEVKTYNDHTNFEDTGVIEAICELWETQGEVFLSSQLAVKMGRVGNGTASVLKALRREGIVTYLENTRWKIDGEKLGEYLRQRASVKAVADGNEIKTADEILAGADLPGLTEAEMAEAEMAFGGTEADEEPGEPEIATLREAITHVYVQNGNAPMAIDELVNEVLRVFPEAHVPSIHAERTRMRKDGILLLREHKNGVRGGFYSIENEAYEAIVSDELDDAVEPRLIAASSDGSED
jgi:hypothetical protein